VQLCLICKWTAFYIYFIHTIAYIQAHSEDSHYLKMKMLSCDNHRLILMTTSDTDLCRNMWSDCVKRSPQHLMAICWRAEPIGSKSMRSAIVCSRVWNVEGRGWTASPAMLMSLNGCSQTPCRSWKWYPDKSHLYLLWIIKYWLLQNNILTNKYSFVAWPKIKSKNTAVVHFGKALSLSWKKDCWKLIVQSEAKEPDDV
jgi:hypothetical protein